MATDISPRALACARDNVGRLHLSGRVDVVGPCLFPAGRADLVVCNPPWTPARPTSAVELGVYDPDSAMLHGFLRGPHRPPRTRRGGPPGPGRSPRCGGWPARDRGGADQVPGDQ